MSQYVPALAVLMLLRPNLVWSEEQTSSPLIGGSSQDVGTGVMQDRNAMSSVTNLMPVHSISYRQNAHGKAPETIQDLQSTYRGEPFQIPTYVMRPPKATRLNPISSHGSFTSEMDRRFQPVARGGSPPEIDRSNPPTVNSASEAGSTREMTSSLASVGESGLSNPNGREPPNKIPIYVIRPSHPRKGSPTLVNMAVLSPEQLNPEIIRILQSLGLSQDRVPLVLVTGPIPSLTEDTQNDAETGINTMEFGSIDEPNNQMMNMIVPDIISNEEWYDDELMTQERLMHGRRPSSFLDIGKFALKPPAEYWLPRPVSHQNKVPMNTGHFSVPRGRNASHSFLPFQQNILRGMIVPQGHPQPAIGQIRIPKYPITHGNVLPYDSEYLQKPFADTLNQHPRFPQNYTPSPKLSVYELNDYQQDLDLKNKYHHYPSADAQEPHIQYYPPSAPFKNDPLHDFQNRKFFPPEGKAPKMQDQPTVNAQLGRLIIPETPSQYPLSFPENIQDYPITAPKQLYPDQQTKYISPQPKYPSSLATGEREEPMKHRPESVYDVGKVGVQGQTYSVPQEKYTPLPSGDYTEPIYYPGADNPPYTGSYPGFPHDEQRTDYPRHLVRDREPETGAGPDLVSSVERFNIPVGGQAPGYPINPVDETEPQPRPISNVVSNLGRMIVTEKTSVRHPENYQQLPFSGTYGEPQQPLKATPPGIPSEIQYSDYPSHSKYNREPLQRPRYDIATNLEKLIVQEQPSENLHKIYPHIPYSRYHDPAYHTSDSDEPIPDESQLPGFPTLGKVTSYPVHHVVEREPQTRTRPGLVFQVGRTIKDEQPYLNPQQNSPQFPSTDNSRPAYYPDGHIQPGFPSYNQVSDHPNYPIDYSQPQIRPRLEIAVKAGRVVTPENPISVPQQKPSSVDDIEPISYLDDDRQQLHQGQPSSEGQVAEYPKNRVDGTEPEMKPSPKFFSNVEKFHVPKEPHQGYQNIPSSDASEPMRYTAGSPLQPTRRPQPDFQLQVQDANEVEKPTDNTETKLRPTSDIKLSIEKFNIPEQPQLIQNPKFKQVPSLDIQQPINYPEIQKGRNGERYPEILSEGQMPAFPTHPTDLADKTPTPQPVIVTEMKEFVITHEPNTISDNKYPFKPSSDTEHTRKSPSRQQGSPLYPSSDNSRQIYIPDSRNQESYDSNPMSEYPKRPIISPLPEILTEMNTFNIPNTVPGKEQPQHPSTGTGAPRYISNEGSRPSGGLPRLPTNSYIPGQIQPTYPSISRDDLVNQLKLQVPVQVGRMFITEKPMTGKYDEYPQYPSVSIDSQYPDYFDTIQIPMYYDHDIPKSSPTYLGQKPSMESKPNVQSQFGKFRVPTQVSPQYPANVLGQPKEPQPQTPPSYDTVLPTDTPILYNSFEEHREPSLKPEIMTQLGRVNVAEPSTGSQIRYVPPSTPSSSDQQSLGPYPGLVSSYQNQHYPKQPSTGGKEPIGRVRPDISLEVRRMFIPEKTLMEPDMLSPLHAPNSFPKPSQIEGAPATSPGQFFPQHLSPSRENSLPSHKIGHQPHEFEAPKITSRVLNIPQPQHPGTKLPTFEDQSSQYPTYISAPTYQPQQENSQYPSSDMQRIPERPDIASQIGAIKIPKDTLNLRNPTMYPKFVSSDIEEPVQYLSPHTQQAPTDKQHQSPMVSVIHPTQPQLRGIVSLFPKPDFTSQIEALNIPEEQKSLAYPQQPSIHTLEQQRYPNASPQEMQGTESPSSGTHQNTMDIPQLNPSQYPLRNKQPQAPDFISSHPHSTPFSPKQITSDRTPQSARQVYPKNVLPTSDIVANVERFEVPERPYFSQPQEDSPQYLPGDGLRLQPGTNFVPPLNMRLSNDIDIKLERLTVPGQMKWQPGARYPSADMQKPEEYPDSFPRHPGQRPEIQLKPDNLLPVEGYGRPEIADSYPSLSRHMPHQPTQVSILPKNPSRGEYNDYPYKDTSVPLEQYQPHVPAQVEGIREPDQPNQFPIQKYPQYPSLKYHLDEQQLPTMRQLKPDVQMEVGRFEVKKPLGPPHVDEGFQNFYSTTRTPATQQQWNAVPLDSESINPQPSQDKGALPVKHYENPSHVPQMSPQFLPTTIGIDTYSDDDTEILRKGLPTVDKGYPLPKIEVSPVMHPTSSTKSPELYGREINTFSDSHPGKSSPGVVRPSGTPLDMTEEGYLVDGYLPEAPGPETDYLGEQEPQFYPLNQLKYSYEPPQHYPSSFPPNGEAQTHMKRPRVFVYPVPRQPGSPLIEFYRPQEGQPPKTEPFGYPPRTQDQPVHGQMQIYPHLHPAGRSPSLIKYDISSTPVQQSDFSQDLPRPLAGRPQPVIQTTYLPGTVPTEGKIAETSSMPSPYERYSTSVNIEPLTSQSAISPFLPDVPQPSAEQIIASSTLNYPHEIQPSTSTIQHPKPLGPNMLIPALEGIPTQSIVQPGSDGGFPLVPQSPQDVSQAELPVGPTTGPEEFQPAGDSKKRPEPKYGDDSSVNTLDFPSVTEGDKKHKPASVGSSTLSPADEERGSYPDVVVVTTSESSTTGSAPDGLTISQPTNIPQVMPTGQPLLGEPSNGVTDFLTQVPTLPDPGTSPGIPDSPQNPSSSLLPDSKITRIFPVSKPTFYTDKDGQKFVSLKLLNEPISGSPTGEMIPGDLSDSTQQPKTTDLVIPIEQDFSDKALSSSPRNATQRQPMLQGIPISNVQVFDAQAIIKVIESCNCSNLKFLIPILKRPQSAVVMANNEPSGITN